MTTTLDSPLSTRRYNEEEEKVTPIVESPAWATVDDEEDFETDGSLPQDEDNDSDEKEGISPLTNNADDDNSYSDNEENNACGHSDQHQDPNCYCSNLKGFCNTLAEGLCSAVNTLVSKLTAHHVFVLFGAFIAGIFNTTNVAKETTNVANDGDNVLEISDDNKNISSDNIIIDTVVDSITSEL